MAMLLILLEEGGYKPSESPFLKALRVVPQGREVWFTTENVLARYGISASMRSRWTKELENAHLLDTKCRPVGPPGTQVSFTTEKVRNVYVLQGDAVVEDKETEAKRAKVFATKPVPTLNPIPSEENKPRQTKQVKK